MLSQISWLDFFKAIGLITVIYYLYVLIRYYPQKLKNLFASRKNENQEMAVVFSKDESDINTEIVEEIHEQGDTEMDKVEALITSIVQLIKEASTDLNDPEQFKASIHSVLSKCDGLQHSLYRPSINELISTECSKYGTFRLSVEEVDVLWD
ncbi:hypothetical protein [Fluviicola sp.]|uniref:hypothetical protein n=1 Tax=Fluviicola sp. TaxID=1917219 RepID=UPI0031E257BF